MDKPDFNTPKRWFFDRNWLINFFLKRAFNQAESAYFTTVFNKDIRYYFDVDGQYVVKKLLVILFPFMYKVNIFLRKILFKTKFIDFFSLKLKGDWKKTKQNYNSLHQGFLSPKFLNKLMHFPSNLMLFLFLERKYIPQIFIFH